jgi:CBS domain-containing protein
MNVAAILKAKGRTVATARPDTTIAEVTQRLAAKRIGAIVVVGAEGRVDGIISERDVIRAVAGLGAGAIERPVGEFMTRDVITCTESDTIDQVMSTMTAGRFRHLPVVVDGALVGIVSIGDVVKHHIAEVEMEAIALKTYLVAG